jgi:hypothetical protein
MPVARLKTACGVLTAYWIATLSTSLNAGVPSYSTLGDEASSRIACV